MLLDAIVSALTHCNRKNCFETQISDARKRKNIARANTQNSLILQVVREMDGEMLHRAIEEARRRWPDVMDTKGSEEPPA